MVHDDVHILVFDAGISGFSDLYRRDDLLIQRSKVHGKCEHIDLRSDRDILLNIKLIPSRLIRYFFSRDLCRMISVLRIHCFHFSVRRFPKRLFPQFIPEFCSIRFRYSNPVIDPCIIL